MRELVRWLTTIALFSMSAGCGGSPAAAYTTAARARGAAELGCPLADVAAVYLGGGGVDVRGCGLRQTFTCATTPVGYRREAVCAPDGAPSGTFVAPAVRTDEPGAQGASVLDMLAPCQITPGSEVSVAIGVDGDVLQLEVPDQPPGARACAEAALRDMTFVGGSDAVVVRVTIPAPPPPATEAVATPAPAASGEAAARAAIDAARDAILACNGGAALAIVGDWTADGALTMRLPDARAGTPEDGCVRAAGAGARIDPPPGTAGSVLHPVH